MTTREQTVPWPLAIFRLTLLLLVIVAFLASVPVATLWLLYDKETALGIVPGTLAYKERVEREAIAEAAREARIELEVAGMMALQPYRDACQEAAYSVVPMPGDVRADDFRKARIHKLEGGGFLVRGTTTLPNALGLEARHVFECTIEDDQVTISIQPG